ncbi:hypothetical protein SORBI_3005G133350 [Sorghum bicolor]|uniref:Uncharacterized protein n=1 Tax=Sorghum bicolor TaxID=4558 RepID=A0A1Z5RIJ1_SORBI|nr:hypothetical protein SORBI_3005G133350 [Sorghum bicolor]
MDPPPTKWHPFLLHQVLAPMMLQVGRGGGGGALVMCNTGSVGVHDDDNEEEDSDRASPTQS